MAASRIACEGETSAGDDAGVRSESPTDNEQNRNQQNQNQNEQNRNEQNRNER
jgi:hypothetical protein